MYSRKILEEFKNPQNVGMLKGASAVGTFENEKTLEVAKLYVIVENDIISQVKFKAFGSPIAIATGSIITKLLLNQNINDINITLEEIISQLGEVEENKLSSVENFIYAISSLVADYKKKQERLLKKQNKLSAKF